MRMILPCVILVLLLSVATVTKQGNLLKNGDFEKFVAGEPSGWVTNNIPNALFVVSPSSRCRSGKNSLKCEVKEFYGTCLAGTARQKDIEVSEGEFQLNGFYVLKSIGKDVGFISIDVKTREGSTIAACEHYLIEATNDFQPFTYSAKLPERAKRLEVVLTLLPEEQSTSLHDGSYILFDALEAVVVGKAQKPS